MKRTSRTLTLALVAATAVTANAANETNAVPVSVVQTITKTLEIEVTAPGELESLADPVIAAEAGGRVLEVLVKEGETVDTRQLLATLDPEPYEIALEQARAQVAKIEALISNQRLTVKRLQDLTRKQSAAQHELDKAKAELAAGRADLAAAKARVRDARYRLAKTSIKSPVRGQVQARHISAGDYVKTGDPAFQIVATDTLSARLFFPETLATRVRTGLPVVLRAGAGQRTADAEITRFLPALDPGNRSLAVMVDFENDYGWRPGLSITAEVTVGIRDNAVMAPVRSVVRRPAGTVVYRVENGRALEQTVELGQRDGDWVEIVSGLAADTAVAVDGAGFLTDGVTVEIRGRQP